MLILSSYKTYDKLMAAKEYFTKYQLVREVGGSGRRTTFGGRPSGQAKNFCFMASKALPRA